MRMHKNLLVTIFFVMALVPLACVAKISTAQYADEISQSEELGKIIYEKDIAAWVGTDKMLADLGDDVSGLPIKGWVTDHDGEYYRVNFIGVKDGKTNIYYRAWVKGNDVKKAKIYKQGIPLTSEQMIMWTARQLVLKQNFEMCSSTYNTVVVPYGDASSPKLYVYLFASTTNYKKVVFGGHYRYSVSLDGKTVLSKIAFSNACMELDKDTNAVAMVVTHLKTNFPQEHHVFIALSHGLKLYVSTVNGDVVYEVSNGEIRDFMSDN